MDFHGLWRIGDEVVYDACFLCDGAYYQHANPKFIVSAAVCDHPTFLRANWYYKFPEALCCDRDHKKGVELAEIGSVHAALCVVSTFQADLMPALSTLIISDREAFFHQLRGHKLMEQKSGEWLNWEVDALLYQLCDMILHILRQGQRLEFRHKKTI